MTLHLGVRAHDLDAHSVAALAQKTHFLGLRHIQFAPCKSFPVLQHSMLTSGLARQMQQQLQQKTIDISVLGCYVNMVASDIAVRTSELATFVHYLRLARDFGASVVATETGSVGNGYCLENYEAQAFERVVEAMRYLLTQAEKLGVNIALEAGINHPIYSAPKMMELIARLDHSPNIQIILDVANLMTATNVVQQTAIIEEALDLYQDRLVAIHLKDFVLRDQQIVFVPFGQGELAVETLFAFIQRYKPGLYCLFENTKTPDIEQAVLIAQQRYQQVKDIGGARVSIIK